MAIIETSGHVRVVHESQCECVICSGDLFVCSVCGCAEGELPTECPGVKVSPEAREWIYKGRQDFKDGRWITLPIPE